MAVIAEQGLSSEAAVEKAGACAPVPCGDQLPPAPLASPRAVGTQKSASAQH